MKTTPWLFVLAFIIAGSYTGMSQCGTIHSLSYDSTVYGTGGTENPYNLTFPKFDASLGTLTDVRIISVLTVSYHYDVENTGSTAKTIKLRFNRDDEITSSALSEPIDNSYIMPSPTTWFTHNLGASDGITGSGPDFVSIPTFNLLNGDTIIKQSASNPANFLGSGNISFDYSSDMSYTLTPIGGANITNNAAADQIKFILQYVYCDNVILASNITSFSAAKKQDYVNIVWLTSNETSNHTYEIQKSYDGINFFTVTTTVSHPGVNNVGSYEYNYVPQANENGKLYFRIKQTVSGVQKFSPARMVDLSTSAMEIKAGIRLVPNPSTGAFAIMLVNNDVASDWNIELFNMKGQVVAKRQAANTTLAKYAMNETLASGVYFVMVTNKRNNQKFVERLVIN